MPVPLVKAHVAPSRRLVFFRFHTAVLSVPAIPTFLVDGDPVAVNPMAFFTPTSKQVPWVAIQLKDPVKPGQTVQCTAIEGWATTTAGPAELMDRKSIENLAGTEVEPEFVPAAKPKMKLGINCGSLVGHWGHLWSISKNWARRCQTWRGSGVVMGPARSLVSCDPGATVLAVISSSGAENYIDARRTPNPVGTWQVVWDDAEPGNVTMAIGAESNVGTAVEIPELAHPGELINGVQVGQRRASDVQLRPGATHLNPETSMRLTSKSGRNTAVNIRVLAPGNTPELADGPLTADDNVVRWLSLPGGKSSRWVRFMEALGDFANVYNSIVEPGDLKDPDAFSLAGGAVWGATVVEVRPYDITVSPYVYAWQAYEGTEPSPDGSPGPYRWKPATIGWHNFSGGVTPWYVVECRTETPHSYKTGQRLSFPIDATAPTLRITNGTTGGVPNPPVNASIKGFDQYLFVTGPDTFVFTGYSPNLKNVTGIPGGINTVAAPQATNFRVSVTCPRNGTIPVEAACGLVRALPGAGMWLNIPAAANDDCVRLLCEKVRDSLPADTQVLCELGNEIWNSLMKVWFDALGRLRKNNIYRVQVERSMEVYRIAREVLGDRALHCIAGWGTNNEWTKQLIKYVNIYNEAHADDQVPVHRFAVAYYLEAPTDPPWRMACSSILSDRPESLGYHTEWPFTRDMYHELMRHYLLYNLPHNGTGKDGQPLSHYLRDQTTLATYKPVPGQAPLEMVCYESGIQTLAPVGCHMPGASPSFRSTLSADLMYDPGMYHSINAHHLSQEQGGITESCYWQVCAQRIDTSGGKLFCLNVHALQQPGYGESNLFAADDRRSHDDTNDSVSFQAWRDWAAAANDEPPPPPAESTDVKAFIAAGKAVLAEGADVFVAALGEILRGGPAASRG